MGISVESTEWLFTPLFPGRIGIWKCCFLWREENRGTRGKPSEQRREPTTNSTHTCRRDRESNQDHIGRRRVLSQVRHPCSLKRRDNLASSHQPSDLPTVRSKVRRAKHNTTPLPLNKVSWVSFRH